MLFLPYISKNTSICLATTLSDYLSKTRNMRTESTDRPLLTNKRPHKPATAQPISRWVKLVLSASGVDVSMQGIQHEPRVDIGGELRQYQHPSSAKLMAGRTPTARSLVFNNNRESEFARSICRVESESRKFD